MLGATAFQFFVVAVQLLFPRLVGQVTMGSNAFVQQRGCFPGTGGPQSLLQLAGRKSSWRG